MRVYFFIIILFFFYGSIKAQVQEQLSPTEKRYQSVVTEPLTTYKGFFRAGLSGAFTVADKYFNDKAKRVLIDNNGSGNAWTVSPYFLYGVTDRFQVELGIPYEDKSLTLSSVFQLPHIDSTFLLAFDTPTKGLGDLTITFGYQLIHGNYTKPFLGLFVAFTLPTGEKNPTKVDPNNPNNYVSPSGRGQFSIEPTLRYRQIVFPYSYDLSLSYKNNFGGKKIFSPTDTEERPFKTGNLLNASGAFNIHLNNWIILKNSVNLNFFGEGNYDGKKGDTAYLITYSPGLIFQVKGLRIATTIAHPAFGKSVLADPIYVMILQYTF